MTQAPPGWRPDAHDPSLLRWWDGRQWTSDTRPQPGAEAGPPATALASAPDESAAAWPSPAAGWAGPPIPERPRLGPGWRTLSLALQLALTLIVVVDLGIAALSWAYVVTFRRWRDDPLMIDEDLGASLDSVALLLYVAWLALFVVTAALFITWLFRAHRSDRMDKARLHHASGWAIGGWFVPILNLWRPVQMVRDLFRGAGHDDVPVVVGIWWAVLLLSGLMDRLSLALLPAEDLEGLDYLDASISSSGFDIAVAGVELVAALLAIAVVRRATRVVLPKPAYADPQAAATS